MCLDPVLCITFSLLANNQLTTSCSVGWNDAPLTQSECISEEDQTGSITGASSLRPSPSSLAAPEQESDPEEGGWEMSQILTVPSVDPPTTFVVEPNSRFNRTFQV